VVLDLAKRAEPRALTLAREDDPASAAALRYGASRRYAAGRYPRWVEWRRRGAEVRLDLRDVDPLPEGTLRALPPPRGDWRVVSLDDPEGRRLLGRLLGSYEEEDSR
jgi:hypothetical protein